jgi:hypothetical protein
MFRLVQIPFLMKIFQYTKLQLVGRFETVFQSPRRNSHYTVDICLQKVKVPLEKGGFFLPRKSYSNTIGEKCLRRNSPIWWLLYSINYPAKYYMGYIILISFSLGKNPPFSCGIFTFYHADIFQSTVLCEFILEHWNTAKNPTNCNLVHQKGYVQVWILPCPSLNAPLLVLLKVLKRLGFTLPFVRRAIYFRANLSEDCYAPSRVLQYW